MNEALRRRLESPQAAALLRSLYGPGELESAKRRYASLITGMVDLVSQEHPELAADKVDTVRFFTAPGRTELGGNHTDHNHGKVLAASIQLDAVALVLPRDDTQALFRSTGYPDVRIDLADLSPRAAEEGTTEALLRGVAGTLAAEGLKLRGFTAQADSTVFAGSGLSSSAAMEVLFAAILDHLYGEGKRSALELAKIGQKAENAYFGKPSGLMDQTACAYGGGVLIDFEHEQQPHIQSVHLDMESCGLCLCVVHTRGSHADLTPAYAAIPQEMKAVARFFGKPVLRELDRGTLLAHTQAVRKKAGDRAFLRALHFFDENQRVDAMGAALEKVQVLSGAERTAALMQYLSLVTASGDSSWKLLQNLSVPQEPQDQGLPLALALTRSFFEIPGTPDTRLWAARVHGGGFAGTIQAYIPLEDLDAYRALMESVFGPGALTPLRIRSQGAVELPL
ncbi:MAG: galactokinase [Spirochaetaceae bacterium]|nr:galactokinase [Spirochaetaceae bacterium]